MSDSSDEPEGNRYFRMVIEDALASLDDPLTLKEHVVDRILKTDQETLFGPFMAFWYGSDQKQRIEATLYKLSQKITLEIFGKWEQILGRNIGQKELIIDPIIETEDGNNRIVYLGFSIKEGLSRYKISERSLGFRWFFCFLLFTRFMKNRYNESGTVFLFDEPASNLHSAAQAKLLDSLDKIASGENDIIYSTHSHYLINPLWLETAYVVSNGADRSDDLAGGEFRERKSDITALLYRDFVGQNPEKTNYFQPILDRLEFSPSALEAAHGGVLVEGKSDFYILNWYKKRQSGQSIIDFIPVGGSSGAGPLLGLYLGLARKFVLLLDGDISGYEAKKRYLRNYPIEEDRIVNIDACFPGKKIKEIEDIITIESKQAIASYWGVKRASKKHIQRYFSEASASGVSVDAHEETIKNINVLYSYLAKLLH